MTLQRNLQIKVYLGNMYSLRIFIKAKFTPIILVLCVTLIWIQKQLDLLINIESTLQVVVNPYVVLLNQDAAR